MGSSLVQRSEWLAFEVDDPVPVIGDEDLSEVVVAVDTGDDWRVRERLEDRQLGGDRGSEVMDETPGLPRGDLDGAYQLALGRPAPGPELDPGSLPGSEFGDSPPIPERDVETRGQGAELGGDFGGEFDADLPRREEPGSQRFGDRLVRVRTIGNEGLGHGECRGTTGSRDDLGIRGEGRNRGKAGRFGQESEKLELRI